MKTDQISGNIKYDIRLMLDWMFGNLKPRAWFKKKNTNEIPENVSDSSESEAPEVGSEPNETQIDHTTTNPPEKSILSSVIAAHMSYMPAILTGHTNTNSSDNNANNANDELDDSPLGSAFSQWIALTSDRELFWNSLLLAYRGLGQDVRMAFRFEVDEGVSDIWFSIIRDIFEEQFPGSTTDEIKDVNPDTRLVFYDCRNISTDLRQFQTAVSFELGAIIKHHLQMHHPKGQIYKPRAICLIRIPRHWAANNCIFHQMTENLDAPPLPLIDQRENLKAEMFKQLEDEG